jgi:hypothetical protein
LVTGTLQVNACASAACDAEQSLAPQIERQRTTPSPRPSFHLVAGLVGLGGRLVLVRIRLELQQHLQPFLSIGLM